METKFDIVQKMVDDTHFYWVDGEFMPSVTHILEVAAPKEFGLLNFFKQNTPEDIESKSNAGKENGSLVHDACEKLLNGIEIPLKDYPYRSQKALWSFKQWYDLFKPKSLITEQMVASKVYKYAGTLDLVCTIDSQILNSFDKGKRTSKTTRLLIDFKTNKGSIYFENKLQTRAYDQAYTETSGETVDECWILRLGSQHKAGYEFKQVDDVKIQDFMNVYQTYLTINGGKIEDPPIVDVYPETLQFELF